VGCEEFKTEKELVNGHCSEHPNTELQKVSEENYFFKLGNYQEKLLELIESNTLRIIPETRKNEVVAFIKAGLEDLSISRSTARARGWGVPVPGDESQVMYVWVDALSNYITALGYADDTAQFEKFWKNADDSVHAIGKGITRFHAVYWPAFLLSAGIPLPKTLLVHGYVTVNGQKMSKSVGNVVDPAALAEEYGAEAFRYFIAREVSQFEDSDFTSDRFAETYEANLVNGLGNQVARIMKLAETHLTEPVPEAIVVLDAGELQTPFSAALDAFNIQAAADLVWEHIGKADAYIQETQPFRLVKSEDPAEKEKGIEIIRKLVRHAAEIAVHLRPILPDTAAKIEAAIRGNRMPESLFPRKIA
jgi:methionyl-tRNA synthetase